MNFKLRKIIQYLTMIAYFVLMFFGLYWYIKGDYLQAIFLVLLANVNYNGGINNE